MEFKVNKPPYEIPLVPRDEILKISDAILAKPSIPIKFYEDIFRINVAGLDWDIGLRVYEPEDESKIPVGKDGKKIGFFLIHGGGGDARSHDPLGRMLAEKFGYKAVLFGFPGTMYFPDKNHDWPGEPMYPNTIDLSKIEYVRTPMWTREYQVSRDEYDIRLDDSKIDVYGTMVFAKAKKGTEFYARLAAWPWAYDEALKESCKRQMPESDYSIYAHGHSTGGPFSFLMSQRVPNIRGIVGIENSPFGRIFSKMVNITWNDMPFDELRLVCWRNQARYYGDILIKREGAEKAMMRLASVMQEVFAGYLKQTGAPNFRVESLIHHDGVVPMEAAARATAERLNMDAEETEALVKKFLNYNFAVSGPDVKPVPPYLNILTKTTRNHPPRVYTDIALPMLAEIDPAPKVCVFRVDAGRHSYGIPEDGFPMGLRPVLCNYAHEAIHSGFFEM